MTQTIAGLGPLAWLEYPGVDSAVLTRSQPLTRAVEGDNRPGIGHAITKAVSDNSTRSARVTLCGALSIVTASPNTEMAHLGVTERRAGFSALNSRIGVTWGKTDTIGRPILLGAGFRP
jgi:hypothetical protein